MRLAALATALLAPSLAIAGAWVRPAGGVWLQAGPSLFEGTEQVSGGGFEGRAIELYGEVGLGADVELVASARLIDHRLTMLGETRRATGWGDVEALVEWAPVNGQSALALRGGLRLSPYDTPTLSDRAGGAPTAGPGGTDILLGAGWGHGFARGWTGVELLHRVRLGCVCNALDLRAEAGVFAVPWLGLAATASWQPAYGRDGSQPVDAPAPIPSAGGLGGKLFVAAWAGLGLLASYDWMPAALNDGPGHRVALTMTWERAPE